MATNEIILKAGDGETDREQRRRWADEASITFDSTHGYSMQELLEIGPLPELPEGGVAFWQGRYQEALKVDPCLRRTGESWEDENGRWEEIRHQSVGGRELGGFLLHPAEGEVECLAVAGHGGSGLNKLPPHLWKRRPRTAYLFFNCRGLPSHSLFPDLPSNSKQHALIGIESHETYIHVDCCSDVWCAVSALLSEHSETDLPLVYQGGSFSGGIGAMSIPWDHRIKAAALRVPTVGNHPLRLRLECTGVGESVQAHWKKHPEIAETLRWVDAAATIRHATQPIQFMCGLMDPKVPPAGQFSVWRAHPGPKQLVVWPAGHLDFPGQRQLLDETFELWLEFTRREAGIPY